MIKNTLDKARQPKFSVLMQQDTIKNLVNNTLGDKKKAESFTTAIISAVSVNPALQDCDGSTILSAGLLGETLNLSPSPQLGHYYLVPFNNSKANKKDAQFQLGYKGYLQLAIRSGQYKHINVVAIKKGELESYNPLTEEIKVNIMVDEEQRENAETIGYYAMFELVNGFVKNMYWSKKKMEVHALKYSMGYKAKKGYTFWEKDFDGMAFKTMLRQLISKWGIMSTELQKAYTEDYSVKDAKGNTVYVDNNSDYEEVNIAQELIKAETKETLNNTELL